MASGNHPTQNAWRGTVPVAVDGRIVTVVVSAAAVAAAVNLPYGGLPVALVSFAVLVLGGLTAHALGQRRLRQLTDRIVTQWAAAGGEICDVSRTGSSLRTEWVIETEAGPVTVSGLALAPVSRLSIAWGGFEDDLRATTAARNIDGITDGLYREIFEFEN